MAPTTHAPLHGTVNRYVNRGCRCVRCRQAWREYFADYRRSRGMVGRGGQYGKRIGTRKWHPTPLGEQIVKAAQARTGWSFDDVFEAIVRRCGPRVCGETSAAI